MPCSMSPENDARNKDIVAVYKAHIENTINTTKRQKRHIYYTGMCVYVCMYLYMFVNVYECVSECLYHTCVHGYLFVCACICVGVCTTYIVLRTLYNLYNYIFVYVCVCVVILVCVCDINTNRSNIENSLFP